MNFEFRPFRLDAGERALRNNAELVPLSPKTFDVLLALVQNGGRILTKRDLMECVWGETSVEESNLHRQVSMLRKTLSKHAGNQQFIETIPWRGYRFIAPVRQLEDDAASIRSLAVLPFANDSADPSLEYLADGLAETLINQLSLVSHLKIMSSNSVRRYKVAQPGAAFVEANVVGGELKVRALLTGRIRQTNGTLIVSVELTDAVDNRLLWGAQHKQQLSDIFSLQETLSREILERLRVRLSVDDQQKLVRRRTQNSEAYYLYLKGRFFWSKLTFESVEKAVALFQRAIETDPNYALPYAALIDCYISADPVAARNAAVKALELDPTLAEAHASLGFLTMLHEWNWSKAEAELRRAIELNGNCAQAHQWYGLYLAKMGRHQEAVEESARARELDPMSLPVNLTRAMVLCFARQYRLAIEELESLLELESDSAATHYSLAFAHMYRRNFLRALTAFRKAAELLAASPQTQKQIEGFMACCYAASGKPQKAKAWLKTADEKTSPYLLGLVQAHLGNREVALEYLERACNERNVQVVALKVDPALDPLRSSRRFQSLLSRVGLA